LGRETPNLFVSSGSSLLRDTLGEGRDRFLRPARLNGAIFFVDDLPNVTAIYKADLLITITNQFQWFGIESMNYSS
jgi:hypothetical protein